MVHDREHARRIDDRTPGRRHALQRGGTGPFVKKDTVDGDQPVPAAQIGNDMSIPDLLKERFSQFAPPDCASPS
jgi:hypothetical protein